MEGSGSVTSPLTKDAVQDILAKTLSAAGISGKKLLVVIPDSTRSGPLPLLFESLCSRLSGQVKKLDFLVALGTHPPMDEAAIDQLVGMTRAERQRTFGNVEIFNHSYKEPGALVKIGTLTEEEVERATGGLFKMSVNIEVNRRVFDYDHLLICGPVFPHEVVGFSGGLKYFFPGIGGAEFIHFFHWVGAVITNPRIIGNKNTPVRALVNMAARFLTVPAHALCMVVHHGEVYGLFGGSPLEAWSKAADLSEKLHILKIKKPFAKILSCAPAMYDDLWTGGKCMYKLEKAVEDGGELIIYAPHITEVSYSHGKVLDEIGYHVRDYFLKQWDRFKHHPWGVIAHSTHVRGIGTYENGVEKGRIRVTLATGIPEARCRKINLGYQKPDTININEWKGKENEGVLVVPKAGEILYALEDPPEWQK